MNSTGITTLVSEQKLARCKMRLCFPLPAVTLYNCSVGRQDCSLCKSADMTYRCVWCAKQKACVYEKLCNPEQQGADDPYATECPNPEITDVSCCHLSFKQSIKGFNTLEARTPLNG